MRHAFVLFLAVTAAGCAAKAVPPPASRPVDLSPADALFDAGCYRCLRQAFEIYDQALGSQAPPPGTREKTFAAAVLLALREKEIGLQATPWLERASALATSEERRYVDVATALPWTNAGSSVDFEPTLRLSQADSDSRLAAAPASAYPILDQYIRLTLRCPGARPGASPDATPPDLSRPILRYRLGLCGIQERSHLDALVAGDPRFVEAWFFIGRFEMAGGVSPSGRSGGFSREWLTRSVPPLLAAHAGLPETPIVTIALAGLMRSRTELARALSLYDEALVLRPAQRDALLGRLITLSYLSRPDEAIATATRMIDLGTWHIGSAYYWRAWNQYQKKALEAAAADVAAARRLLVNDDVMTLSGMVAYDQMRPVDARADFDSAVRMNADRCVAHWYLGLLDLDEEIWPAAVGTFATAGTCYQRAADAVRTEIEQLPPDLPADVREQQVATFTSDITSSLRQAGRSYFNAAQASLRSGDAAVALALARSAANYEEMKEKADGLVRTLERR